jgi:hypothetical protein
MEPEDRGYIVVCTPSGVWCVADPQDDEDGFYVECATEAEARAEWRAWSEQ